MSALLANCVACDGCKRETARGALPPLESADAREQGFATKTKVLMGNEVFELTYRNRETGELCKREVTEFDTAKEIARELAMASGYRAIIKRKREPTHKWIVQLYDVKNNELLEAWSGLSKQEVLMRWKLWREQDTESVLIPWPETMRESLEKFCEQPMG